MISVDRPGPAPLATCPFARGAKPAAVTVEAAAVDTHVGTKDDDSNPRDLAPCHDWLTHDKVHAPVPVISPGEWKNAKHYEVVVVGAGMSGLHTAWRLKGLDGSAKPQEAPEIAVFERTHHMGGRARSTKVDGASIPIDLGAMRFSPQLHPLVTGLAEHFQFPTREFPVSGDDNLQYFRGVRLTNKEVKEDPTRLPFHLQPNEQGKSANELLSMAIEAVIPNFQQLSQEQWKAAKSNTVVKMPDPASGQTQDVPLQELGLQNVLSLKLSREAVNMVTSSLGYHRHELNWDAGQALQNLSENFIPDVTFKTPLDGMKAFPKALATDLKKAGVPISVTQTLRNLDYDKDKKEFHLVFESFKGEITPIRADKVVLAMPKTPLDELVANSPFLRGSTLDKNLTAVTPISMSRIFVAFDQPWWNQMGIQGGRSVTDGPLGQVYYYNQPGDQRPYVQAYVDGEKAAYWQGLQGGVEAGADARLCATPQLGTELHRQLEELHGRSIPAPTGFLYRNWGDEIFGGATHAWNAGSKPLEVSESMIKPLGDLPLYVCGEAFSTTQGWIEGALQTSEKVLASMGKAPSKLQ